MRLKIWVQRLNGRELETTVSSQAAIWALEVSIVIHSPRKNWKQREAHPLLRQTRNVTIQTPREHPGLATRGEPRIRAAIVASVRLRRLLLEFISSFAHQRVVPATY